MILLPYTNKTGHCWGYILILPVIPHTRNSPKSGELNHAGRISYPRKGLLTILSLLALGRSQGWALGSGVLEISTQAIAIVLCEASSSEHNPSEPSSS
jgi:hypothetical protein